VKSRRLKAADYERRSDQTNDVEVTDPLAFPGAGRRRDPAQSAAARERRAEAEHTADILLAGGLRDDEVYVAVDGDTVLDLATHGALRDYLGRQRRRWHGFADEAHALKAKWGREYAAFCGEQGITRAIQVVVRPPVSVIPLPNLRATHTRESASLGDRLRYGRQTVAPSFAYDLISAEVLAAAPQGAEVDIHFHLAVRGTFADCELMRSYFQRSGWSWWDALTDGSQEAERYPGALAQYQSKSLAETIRQATAGGTDFSPENLAELHRQTRHVAMTRATGTFRTWKGQLAKDGRIVVEDDTGRLSVRAQRRLPTLARLRDRLFTTTGASLLRITLHDFGDGEMRPAMRVRGRADISFAEIAATYAVADVVAAARHALLLLGNTATPEYRRRRDDGNEDTQPPWNSWALVGGPNGPIEEPSALVECIEA
jgi:hypothetical protein